MKVFILMLIFSHSISSLAFDHTHALWDKTLKSHISQGEISTMFNYKKLKSSPDNFYKYLGLLSVVTKKDFKSFSQKQKLSFWINAYNAFTVKIILDNYPLKSIKDIKQGGFLGIGGKNAWNISFINLLGTKMTLDNIEHDTIRKNFSEPLIHFAVNCASLGCPSLRAEAFIAEKLDAQLLDGAKVFINNSKKNSIDHKKKKVYLSKIFKWYGDDFKKRYGSYLKFLEKSEKAFKGAESYSLSWNKYGWELNGQ